MQTESASAFSVWRVGVRGYLLILVGVGILAWACQSALVWLWNTWNGVPEYSHGPVMPILAGFLLWQQREIFERQEFRGSIVGVLLLVAAGIALLLGTMGGAYTLQQYAFALGLAGLVLSWTGLGAMRQLALPLALLFLMIPQPDFILNNLSTRLQLVSSALGVAIIRIGGISVYLEGNVIDLGSYKLQVVDACAGLRYLFPLMTLGLLIAHFFRAPLWKRVLVFLASIPVTVVLNSLRIAMIGWMVERWGPAMAEGFLHDFQGWVVFMVSGALLLAFAALLNRVGPSKGRWADVFGVDLPMATPPEVTLVVRPLPVMFWAALVTTAAIAVVQFTVPNRPQLVPEHPVLASFPLELGEWKGKREWLTPDVLQTLQLDDYFFGAYKGRDGGSATLYVPYYATQRDRRVVHSPAACLPGNGWRIAESRTVIIPGTAIAANRLLISNGEERALVYYWFDQRGRNLTSEWLVKWYLFQDSVVRRRSDGAMVRVMATLGSGESVDAVDARLQAFAALAGNALTRYLPE
jgi:exosortase D (VPLPA-CTERM-specific)